MAKLQCEVPSQLGEVIARVGTKTNSKRLSLEYLIYLARFKPRFPKKNYGSGLEENCTLDIERDVYARDFEDYRCAQDRIIRTQKEFFPDALTRGGSMYEAGYRLSDPAKPSQSELQADSFWQSLVAKAGALVDLSAQPEAPYSELLAARRAAGNLMAATLFLLESIGEYHVNEQMAAEKSRLEGYIADFELEPDPVNKTAHMRKFVEYIQTQEQWNRRHSPLSVFLNFAVLTEPPSASRPFG